MATNQIGDPAEAEILAKTRLTMGLIPGVRVFRNNVGKLKDQRGRWVEFGLCVGSSDLIGWRSFVIKPEHVGMKIAQFMAIETKTKDGVVSLEQERFLKTVEDFGGIAIVERGAYGPYFIER